MNTVFLTSKLFLYERDENDNKHTIPLQNVNEIVDRLKENINSFDNLLYIASNETDYETTDSYAECTKESFNLVLPFKNFTILDKRTEKMKNELIKKADLIIIAGGHVPTQNLFFEKIQLKKALSNTNAVILGISAGSMNLAETVFAPPELDGESLDKNYKYYLSGLGFTNINILPHYNDLLEYVLDEKNYITSFVLPYSNKKIYALCDGAYVLIKDGKNTLIGESYLIENGEIKQISTPCEI